METLRERIISMNQRAQEHLELVEDQQRRNGIVERASQPRRKSPIWSQGIVFTSEGIETPALVSEPVDVEQGLPSTTLSWSIRPARYRIELSLKEPGRVTAKTGDQTLVRNKRVLSRGTLEVEAGELTIEASSQILDVDVHRFSKRGSGEIVLGPFPARGEVTARVVGQGNWTAEVAPNRHYQASFTAEPAPSLTLSGPTWGGLRDTVPDELRGGWKWHHARRLADVDAPDWADRCSAGVRRTGHEDYSPDGVEEADHGQYAYWDRIGEWTVLSGEEAPSFDTVPGHWTYVWGRAEGQERTYNMDTGRRTDGASEKGRYLIKTYSPDEVEIEGANAPRGAPIPKSKKTLPPSPDYRRAREQEAPPTVVVRLTGRGVAEAIEIEQARRSGPGGTEQTKTQRIDLSPYWKPDRSDVPSPNHDDGPGLFYPHNETNPSA